MKAAIKKFMFGLVVGALIAFPAGINFGRDLPLWSNPFAKRDIKQRVKMKADTLIEDTKEVIHDATKPARKDMESQVKR